MNLETSDYRQIIQHEFERRRRARSMYSLRAFSRDLQVLPSRLSEVLSGKKGLSRTAAQKIADRLGLSSTEKEVFCDLVDSQHARDKSLRKSAQIRLQKIKLSKSFHQLDAFHLISDWYHLSLLQLTKLDDFQSDVDWMAQVLGLPPLVVQSALDRLVRMGLMEKKGLEFQPTKDYTTTPDVPSAAIREYHRQIHQKALIALETQTIGERDFSSVQMSFDVSDLPKVKKRIKDFRRRLCQDFSEGSGKKDVYCLSIGFFNLTPTKGLKK